MLIVFAVLALVLAGINATQAMTGRQLFGASRSQRPVGQLRRESALAAGAMAAVGLSAVLLFVESLPLALVLFLVGVACMGAIFVLRSRTA